MAFGEVNGLVIGTCMFIASVVLAFRKPSLSGNRPAGRSYRRLYCSPAAMGRTTLIDFQLPQRRDEVIKNLVNDEIISKAIIGGPGGRFYICIHALSQTPSSHIYNYISKLYSKVWDEAVQKGLLDMDCFVISDDLSGLAKRQDILSLPELTNVVTFDSSLLTGINEDRLHKGLEQCTLATTMQYTESLEEMFRQQPRVVILDSHYGEQPREFPKYKRLAMGGTFDRIHFGHRKLLTLAATSCKDRLTIGITGDAMLAAKSNAHLIGNYSERHDNVRDFFDQLKPSVTSSLSRSGSYVGNGTATTTIATAPATTAASAAATSKSVGEFSISSHLTIDLVELTDPYGPTITDAEIEAIIVSSETIRGAFKINQLRAERGMKPLEILVTYRSDAAILSSSFLRNRATAPA